MKREISDPSMLISSNYGTTGWSLCIGAGTSLGIFKLWNDFAMEVYSEAELPDIPQKNLKATLEKFGPNSLLQATQNYLEESDADFAQRLSENLYRNLKSLLAHGELSIVETVFTASYPLNLSPAGVLEKFSIIRDKYFSQTSAYVLAKRVLDLFESGHGPSEIISFNAEPLFLSIFYSFIFDKNKKLFLDGKHTQSFVDIVTRSISTVRKGNVRFIYLHGLLPINPKRSKAHFTPEKLVFRETEYSAVANTNYNWASSTFLNVANSRPILFVGMSLSDSNVRKWLSWVQATRREEIGRVSKSQKPSSRHYWIEQRQATPAEDRLLSAFVYHLGVRIMWLEDWSKLDLLLEQVF